MTSVEEIGSIDIRGEHLPTLGRLERVCALVDDRRQDVWRNGDELLPPAWRNGPAFEVHIWSGLAELLADLDNMTALRYIVEHGKETHVVVFLHEPVERVSVLLANRSGKLADSLIESRALRHAGGRS